MDFMDIVPCFGDSDLTEGNIAYVGCDNKNDRVEGWIDGLNSISPKKERRSVPKVFKKILFILVLNSNYEIQVSTNLQYIFATCISMLTWKSAHRMCS